MTDNFLSINEYTNIAIKCISKIRHKDLRKKFLNDIDVVDYVQDYIMQADWTFDEAKSNGMDRMRYRRQQAIFAIKHKIRELTKKKKVSFDKFRESMKQNRFASPIDAAIESEERKLYNDNIDKILDKRIKRIPLKYFRDYLDGMSVEDIAAKYKIGKRWVNKCIANCMRKLKNVQFSQS